MKPYILFLLNVCAGSLLTAAQPSIQWQMSFGGTAGDHADCVRQCPDSGFIITGYTASNNGDVSGNHGLRDFWTVKTLSTGIIQWQKCYGGSSDDEAHAIQPTPDGGYILVGNAGSTDGDVSGNNGFNDYWILKLQSNGSIQWKKCYGGSDDDQPNAVQTTSDGGYIVAGSSYSIDSNITNPHGKYDFWIVKLFSNGNLQWQKSLGGPGDDEAYSIQQTADSGYIVAGASNSNSDDVSGNHGRYDYWVVKLDASGNIQWQKTYGGSMDDFAYSVQQTSDGGYIVAGYASSSDGDITGNLGSADYWILKLQSDGTIQWQKSFGGSKDDESYSIQQTTDGGYIVGGYTLSTSGDVSGGHGLYDYWVVKLNSDGDIQWQKCLGGTKNEFGHSVRETFDGGFIVAGYSFSNDGDVSGNHGVEDFWVVKLSSFVNIGENEKDFLSDCKIYPNPARDHLTILTSSFSYYELWNVSVWNTIGEKVFLPISNSISGKIEMDISSLPDGVYFVVVEGPARRSIARFVKE